MSTTTESAAATPTPPEAEPPVDVPQATLGESARAYLTRVRGGDVGALPAVAGLIVLVIVFSALRPSTFTDAFNFANLIQQGAPIIVLAMGLVFVLLLGEIDLSAGVAAGTSAAVMGVFLTNHHVAWPLSTIICLLTGAVIGTCIGLLVAWLGIPSFVVTLAAFLGLQGVTLVIIGEGGTIGFRDKTILAVMNNNMPVWLGWVLFVVGIGGYALLTFRRSVSRRRAGLTGDPIGVWAFKSLALAVIVGAGVAYHSKERSPGTISIKGVPIVVVVLVVLLLGLTFVLTRTAWGRHVYAVGGNSEAARRAGINVPMVRLACFMVCSTLAAVGGILLVSYDNSVSPTTGGALTLLNAVGAAVIGGTSLFGGKGRIVDALIGGFVLAVIANGMALLNQPSGRVYIVTGIVLLFAASVDAISRRRAAASGRA
jgi:D-xylose transport system permease protein